MRKTSVNPWPGYRTVWRWHFYAGMLSIPFVLILSITGAIYLFKSQLQAWNDRPYENLALSDLPKPIADQAYAVLTATPGSEFDSIEITPGRQDAGRVIVRQGNDTLRCYVHPVTLEVLHQTLEGEQFIDKVKKLHSELLLGPRGSYIVELAACWTIVMILSGMYLWWPQKWAGFAGVVYPRLLSGQKPFWRDVHSVTGMWVSVFALILIVTGLPWATFWGGYFKAVRSWTGTNVARQDWSTGGEMPQPSAVGEHASHAAGHRSAIWSPSLSSLRELDQIVARVRPLQLAHPVTISPPDRPHGDWTVQSLTGNRPLRVTMTVHGATGEVTSIQRFADRHWIDRLVGTGIALHEGQLFGWINQAVGLLTVLGLVTLSLTGLVLWWRRRDRGGLGTPQAGPASPRSPLLWVCIAALVIYLPLFGASLLLMLALEKLVLRRVALTREWLGLVNENPAR
ncbi:MAG: PepSY-associated TM helix domain-containing protein [Planctomycetaceae bacterium]